METATPTTPTTARVPIPDKEAELSWEEPALLHRHQQLHLLPPPHQEATSPPDNHQDKQLPLQQDQWLHRLPLPLEQLPRDTPSCRRQPPVRSPKGFGKTIVQTNTRGLRD